MPDGVGPIVTGLLSADTIGVGLVVILFSGKARQARRQARADKAAAHQAEVAHAQAQVARIRERREQRAYAVREARRAAEAEIARNMLEQTVIIERLAWPPSDRDVPFQRMRARPYVMETRPEVLERLEAHHKK